MGFDIAALNIIDFVAIIVLVISGGLATLRGMTRELMGLIGWPIAIIAAKLSAPYLQPTLAELIKVEGISDALAWGVPFVIVVILWFAFSSLVSPGLSKAGLGGLDRWLGFLFGLIRGFVIVLRGLLHGLRRHDLGLAGEKFLVLGLTPGLGVLTYPKPKVVLEARYPSALLRGEPDHAPVVRRQDPLRGLRAAEQTLQ